MVSYLIDLAAVLYKKKKWVGEKKDEDEREEKEESEENVQRTRSSSWRKSIRLERDRTDVISIRNAALFQKISRSMY